MTRLEVQLGEPLFSFATKLQWINKGKSWYVNCGVAPYRLIAIDSAGRVCVHGCDFMRAERERTYPITVYPIDVDTDARV